MIDDMTTQIIRYLEPMQMYVAFLKEYFLDEDLDDFDKYYLGFYEKFETFIKHELSNPFSEINLLVAEYEEFIVDYNQSTLHLCLEAIMESYERRHMYLEGKRDVYLRYLEEVYHLDGKSWLESMDEEEFLAFEKQIFKQFDAIKKPTH